MSDFTPRLRRAVEDGRLRPLDWALADWCLRHGGDQTTALAMILTSRALAEGHTCYQIPDSGPALPGEKPAITGETFTGRLVHAALVGKPGESQPLILDGNRLYLERYWRYEMRLAARLRELIGTTPDAVDVTGLLRAGGEFDYGGVGEDEPHWQAIAAFVAQRHRLCVISGGPGTGKTYTVLRLIRRLLQAARNAGEPAPAIRLAAPTGKAAARMMDSIRAGLDTMTMPDVLRQAVPAEASTLHRLLGFPRHGTQPRYHRGEPLPADVVIVDEASMVDLPMMTKLLDALADHGRLVLLGDRFQLASVESGAVLAELCDAAGVNRFSHAQRTAAGPLMAQVPEPLTDTDPLPLTDHVVTLQTSHRFHRDSAIGNLARAVNAGDPETALAVLREGSTDVRLTDDAGETAIASLCEAEAGHHAVLHGDIDPEEALSHLDARRVLTATRIGAFGSERINQRITAILASRTGTFDGDERWYHGRPVIITRNDYRAGLYNGDTGIVLRDGDGSLRVWFHAEQGLRALLPSAVPEHETVYAMTVHKSQGSEFQHVTLVLPEADHPVATRELLYTGVTRARREVHLVATGDSITAAIQRPVQRRSALAERLSGPGDHV